MAALRGSIAVTYILVHSVLWCSLLYVPGLLRLLPSGRARALVDRLLNLIHAAWIGSNRAMVSVLGLLDIDEQADPLAFSSKQSWNLVLCNHQTWADVIILQNWFLGRVPPLKFITKRVIMWIPFIGLAGWILGHPFVRRYGRAELEANPALRELDKNAMLKACEVFRRQPTSVLIFLEGTRFTAAKHDAQGSPYSNLLMPKSAGLGYVAEALGERVDNVIDVTLGYPDGVPSFWDFLTGHQRRVTLRIKALGVPDVFRQLENGEGRDELRRWVDELWLAKDQQITAQRAQRNSS